MISTVQILSTCYRLHRSSGTLHGTARGCGCRSTKTCVSCIAEVQWSPRENHRITLRSPTTDIHGIRHPQIDYFSVNDASSSWLKLLVEVTASPYPISASANHGATRLHVSPDPGSESFSGFILAGMTQPGREYSRQQGLAMRDDTPWALGETNQDRPSSPAISTSRSNWVSTFARFLQP